MKRTDSASRVIKASPQSIYRAFLDPKAIVAWLPPKGMKAELFDFEPREGGGYRMSLTYSESEHSSSAGVTTPRGKTSEHVDVVRAQFVELVRDQRIVQRVEFESPDPAFAGAMTMTWSLAPASEGEGTEVTILCEDVPEAIRKEDHDKGLQSTLSNLAEFTE